MPRRLAAYARVMALVLTRKEGQVVVLAVDGHEIRVEVVDIQANQVRLAFVAGDDVAIWREEMIDASEPRSPTPDSV